MATATTAPSALADLRRALEANDERGIVDAYADDAVLVSYSERNRPGTASRAEGKEAIRAFVHDVVERDLEHRISDEVVSEDRFAYVETCRYPSGQLVVAATVCELRDGRIARQTSVEAWDE